MRRRCCRASRNRSYRRSAPLAVVEHAREQAAALDLVEPARRLRITRQRRAARGVEFLQHARVEQEVAQRRVEHARAPRWRGSRRPRGRSRCRGPPPRAPLAASRSPAAQPAVRACSARAAAASSPGAANQACDFVGAEAQVGFVEAGELAGGRGACEQRGGRLARRQHQRPARAEALDAGARGSAARARRQMMEVVEHDGATRQLAGVERVDQFVDRLLAARGIAAATPSQSDPRVRRARAGRRARAQQQALEHAVEGVARVQRHPGERLARRRRRQRARQQRGLAEPPPRPTSTARWLRRQRAARASSAGRARSGRGAAAGGTDLGSRDAHGRAVRVGGRGRTRAARPQRRMIGSTRTGRNTSAKRCHRRSTPHRVSRVAPRCRV